MGCKRIEIIPIPPQRMQNEQSRDERDNVKCDTMIIDEEGALEYYWKGNNEKMNDEAQIIACSLQPIFGNVLAVPKELLG